MSEDFLAQRHIDHFLQAEIIQQLVSSDEPLRFSELKEDGIDNSLFMYHAKKLEDRGLIERAAGRFHLTTKGARWANYAGQNFNTSPAPRLLVQCIIRSGDLVLLGSRTGVMKELLNEHLLPGRKHDYGIPAQDVAEDLLKDLFKEDYPSPELLTVAEVIVAHSDKFIHHSISHIYEVILPEDYKPASTDKFEYSWVDPESIDKDSPIIFTLLEQQSSLKPYELFRLS